MKKKLLALSLVLAVLSACAHRSSYTHADCIAYPSAYHGGVRAGLGRQLAGKCKLPYAGLHTQRPTGRQAPSG